MELRVGHRHRMGDRQLNRFRRPVAHPQPMPERGGSLEELRPFVNVGSDRDWLLLQAWLLAAMWPRGPYPILAINGEQGSAKSTVSKLLVRLIDGSDIRTKPNDERDVYVALKNNWLLAYDNMSGVPDWLSDVL